MNNIYFNSPQHTSQLFALAADSIFLIDKEGICRDAIVNDTAPSFIVKEELIDKDFFKVLPKETAQALHKEFDEVLTYRISSSKDFTMRLGRYTYYFECNMHYYEGMVLILCNDITDKMRYSLQLEHRNRQLVEVQKSALLGLWSYNVKQRFFTYQGQTGVLCKEFKQVMGYDEYITYILPEDRETFNERIAQYLKGDLTSSCDYRLHVGNGIYYMHLKPYTCNVLSDNNIIVEGCVQNVTEMQRSRNDITLLTHAINNSTEDIFAAKRNGQLLFANRNFRRHHGIQDDEDITTKYFYQLGSSENNPEVWEELVNSISHDSANNTFVVYNPIDNSPNILAYEGNAYWITSDEGDEVLWAFGRDISQRILHERQLEQMHQELEKAKEKAETSDRLKSAFLANMSHEIRTPLNAIVGFSRLIAESNDYDERKSFYHIVEANNERLLSLINEILDLSKIEANMVEFNLSAVNLQRLFQEIYDAHLLRCPGGVELVCDADLTARTILHTDKNRLFQVISNLIGNAFKYTTQGSVTFGLRIDKEKDRANFFVKDTGAGIPPEKIERVFERFVKANNFVQGTGLGLSISKTIIERLGGEIGVTSEVGKGTTFSFYLPLKSEDVANLNDEEALTEENSSNDLSTASGTISAMATKRQNDGYVPLILAAEDVESNYILLKATVGKRYRLEWAKDGIEAVNMNEDLHPDLILMDMKMPNMGGLDATRIIHEVCDVPIIALTAFAFDSDREAALEAGCVDYMTKPFTPEQIFAMIEKHLK